MNLWNHQYSKIATKNFEGFLPWNQQIIDLSFALTETKFKNPITKTQNNIVIFGFFHKKWYYHFGFFWNNLTKKPVFTKKLFWVLVIGFLNLVSVDAKERSKMFNLGFWPRRRVHVWLKLCTVKCFWQAIWSIFILFSVFFFSFELISFCMNVSFFQFCLQK